MFCLAYIETGNASEAYRRAYDAENMKENSINVNASKLLADANIALRIAALREPVIAKAQITLEQHLSDLKRLRDLAEASEKFGPAVQAEMARGKASGLYVDKQELTGKDGGPINVQPVLQVVTS
jgi:phage terminase small subunit